VERERAVRLAADRRRAGRVTALTGAAVARDACRRPPKGGFPSISR